MYKDKIYKCLVSFVVAVYNTAQFLDDSISSILHQNCEKLYSIFRGDLFEIILVDDGSTDRSGEICDIYASRYSFIKTVHIEHKGASHARNIGINYAEGKYVSFPDSDDVLSNNVLELCISFFEDNYDRIAMVSYPVVFFDGQSGVHWTGYRFNKGSRIVDLMKEPDNPTFFTSSSFFKLSDAKNVQFDPSLDNGEDIIFVNKLLFLYDLPIIGLVCGCEYYYRRRLYGNTSIIQNSKYTVQYYSSYIINVLDRLLLLSIDRYGFVPHYIEIVVIGQLRGRIQDVETGECKKLMDELSYRDYLFHLSKLLKKINLYTE